MDKQFIRSSTNKSNTITGNMSLDSSNSRARNAPFALLPENLASTEKLNIIFEKVFGKIFKGNKARLLKVLDKALNGRQLRSDIETEIQ